MTNPQSVEYKGYTIRRQKTTVKGHTYTRHAVDFGTDARGNRNRRTFKSEAKAKAAIREHLEKEKSDAEAQAILQKKIGEKSKALSTDDLLDAARALDVLARTSTLTDAARFYIEHNTPPDGGERTIKDFVEEHIEAKRKANRRPATIVDLKHRLGKLADKIGDTPVHRVTTADLERVLDEYGYEGATRNTFRRHWQILFRAAIRAGHTENNPALNIEKHSVDEGDIEFFDPQEVEAALRIVKRYDLEHGADALPYFCLALFGGVRPEEIARLKWADVNFKTGRIRIAGRTAKTRRKRNVDMSDNLIAWLTPYKQASGPIAPSDRVLRAVRDRIKRKVRWGHDIMRHTFGTYHYAQHENIGKTARQMGNDIKTAERHYVDAAATTEDAEAFWKIRPKAEAGVIEFPKQKVG